MAENHSATEGTFADASAAHCWRYYLARGFLEEGDIVNDVSCGYGYGSNILSRSKAEHIRGFDYQQDVLRTAQQRHPHISFLYFNLDKPEGVLPECDVTVSIETIEHVDDPGLFIRQIKDSTKRLIIITTPIVPTTIEALGEEKGNPYHHHDFTLQSLDTLVADDQWREFGNSIIGNTGFVVYKHVS